MATVALHLLPEAVAANLRHIQQQPATGSGSTVNQDVQNNLDHLRHRQNEIAAQREAGSKATLDNYGPPQRRFKQWCQEKQYSDGVLVSPDKLLTYLNEEV